MEIIAKIKEIINKMNEKGVPVPMIRVNGNPSLTATMVLLSFNTCLLGQVGKISGFLGGIDLTQSNYLLGITLAAYLGRRMTGDGKKVEIEGDPK